MSNDENSRVFLDILNKLLEQSEETKESISKIGNKLDLHIQKTEFELSAINELDDHQNRLLDEHIKGVRTLEEWLRQHELYDKNMFNELLAPARYIKFSIKILTTIGTLAGSLYTIGKILQWF